MTDKASFGGITITDGVITNADVSACTGAGASAPVSTAQQTALDGKQATLVSATNIKTINGASVLGSGDLTVSAGPPADGSITNAKLADMATKTYKGRTAAGTGVPSDVAVATLKADLALAAADVGLGNVTNESKATMFTNPVFTGTVTIPDAALAIADTSGLQAALDAKQATLVSGTNIKTVNSTTLLGSGDLAISGGDTIAQAAAAAATAINSVSVINMASCTNTVAAGDTFSFYMTGYILNNSGAIRTYTVRLTIGATTFDLVHSTTIAASASNVSYLQVSGEIAVISSSSIGCTINTRFGVGAAVGTAQNNVLAQDRSIVRTSGNNETGSKTIAIGILSSDATATQTFTKTRVEIRKGSAI